MEFEKLALEKFINNNQNFQEKINVEEILESMGK